MKFSKRERFLIVLLILVIIWALAFRLIIVPGYETLVQTREHVEELAEEKDRMDLYLKQFPDLEEKLAALDEGGEEEEFFYRDIDDVFMDQNLQEMAGRAGMDIIRMSIEGPRPMEEKGEEDEETLSQGGGLMETVIVMEIESPGVGQVKDFAQEVYQESKSVLISYIDMRAEDESGAGSAGKSGAGGGGQAGGNKGRGLAGIVEVRYYYEQTK